MQRGGIGFESHTKTHAALTLIEPDRAMEELTAARVTLAGLLGTPVRVLCYPYGKNNPAVRAMARERSEEHTSELQSRLHLVCRLLLEKKKTYSNFKSSHAQTGRLTLPRSATGHSVAT